MPGRHEAVSRIKPAIHDNKRRSSLSISTFNSSTADWRVFTQFTQRWGDLVVCQRPARAVTRHSLPLSTPRRQAILQSAPGLNFEVKAWKILSHLALRGVRVRNSWTTCRKSSVMAGFSEV